MGQAIILGVCKAVRLPVASCSDVSRETVAAKRQKMKELKQGHNLTTMIMMIMMLHENLL
ncbi:hypothetical protein TIFTF001_027622 [Ficus carica]|uniref:Uncharacterized protein n=1 Tax=Ficus carica TaxID=3494 RepID=A0AA88DNB4_FICCA|nr:hypothetical protein TIFTF001_027622 [Ficus carica]